MSMFKKVAVWLVLILIIVGIEKHTGFFTNLFTLWGKFSNPIVGYKKA